MNWWKTRQAARLLKVSEWVLRGLIRSGRVEPMKDSSGDFIWTEADLSAARAALRDRELAAVT